MSIEPGLLVSPFPVRQCFLRDLHNVALRDKPGFHDLAPHPGFALMSSMQRLEYVHIRVQTRLGAVDHRAAYASLAWDQLCRPDAKLTICPIVLSPPVRAEQENDVLFPYLVGTAKATEKL